MVEPRSRLAQGDKVVVEFTDGQKMLALFVAGPQGAGDTFKFTDRDGRHPFEINGNSAEFVGVFMERETTDDG